MPKRNPTKGGAARSPIPAPILETPSDVRRVGRASTSGKAADSIDEPVAHFEGLIEIVKNDQDGTVEFWRTWPGKKTQFVTRVRSGTTGLDGKPIMWVPPPQKALPWQLPRRKQVEHHFARDTDAAYFEDLLQWIKDNVDLPSFAFVVLLAAWIVHTYLIDLITDSPYVLLLGPPESGKTRALNACIQTARRGILTMTAREAALIRYANDFHAAIALDVIDFMAHVRPMQDFFAARTKNDGSVTTRILDYAKGPFKGIQHYQAFGATLVASNTGVDEEWMASRALAVLSCRASREFPRPVDRAIALGLRERGTAFRARVLTSVAQTPLAVPQRLAPGRLGDLLSGLALAVQLTAPSYLSQLQNLVAKFAAERRADVRETLEVEVLRACITHVENSKDPEISVMLKDLVWALNIDRSHVGERALSPRKIGPILRATLGIEPWSGSGNYTYVTLSRTRLTDLAARYGLAAPREDVNVGDLAVIGQTLENTAPPATRVN